MEKLERTAITKALMRAEHRVPIRLYKTATLESDFDLLNDEVVFWLTTQIERQLLEVTMYPATWWDAFKEKWFPDWLLSWYPVVYKKVRTYNICKDDE